jgi:hypothetical protein
MLMGVTPTGGYVLTTTEGSDAVLESVKMPQLQAIAQILGIPKLDDSVKSIYVFRSKKKPTGGGG